MVRQIFRRQTYYDQVVICGWCAESFSEMIEEFVQGNSLQVGFECLELASLSNFVNHRSEDTLNLKPSYFN